MTSTSTASLGCRGGGLKSATFCVLRTKKYDIPRHSKDVIFCRFHLQINPLSGKS
ncbi:hypothetical protein [White spot syndrome virus]|uniref:Uncharacterized protein n=1 Tax=White spot syndrome virus TaxID=342409 RepID=A0A2R2XEY6_9VIRU|nr:hypothetical protein [White spot syndrome virus]